MVRYGTVWYVCMCTYIRIYIYIYYISQLFRCKYASLFLTLFTYWFDCNCGWPFFYFWDSRVQMFSRAFDDCPNENGDMSSIRKTDEWRNTEHCPSQMCIKAPRTYQENERRVWIQLRGITESSVLSPIFIFVGVCFPANSEDRTPQVLCVPSPSPFGIFRSHMGLSENRVYPQL